MPYVALKIHCSSVRRRRFLVSSDDFPPYTSMGIAFQAIITVAKDSFPTNHP